jgi:hypothetical protein
MWMNEAEDTHEQSFVFKPALQRASDLEVNRMADERKAAAEARASTGPAPVRLCYRKSIFTKSRKTHAKLEL